MMSDIRNTSAQTKTNLNRIWSAKLGWKRKGLKRHSNQKGLGDEMLKIRRYEKRDFRAYVSTLEKTTNWGNDAEQELNARIQKLTEEEEIWVAETGVRAVGFMILSPNNDCTLEIDWLDVAPDFQRKGIAASLVDKAAEVAKTKNVEALSVHTSVENKNMIAFLKRSGFKVFERIKSFYGEGKNALRFKKLLM